MAAGTGGGEEREASCNTNHLVWVSRSGGVWDKGTDRKQTLFETIKPYYTLMRKYIGEPRAWGELGVLLHFLSTRCAAPRSQPAAAFPGAPRALGLAPGERFHGQMRHENTGTRTGFGHGTLRSLGWDQLLHQGGEQPPGCSRRGFLLQHPAPRGLAPFAPPSFLEACRASGWRSSPLSK